MHINLDNICFYHHPPAKPSSRALPSSCWRAYDPSVDPQTLPRALSPRSNSHGNLISGADVGVFSQFQAPAREQTDLFAGSEFDLEIERSLTQNNRVADETDLGRYLNSGLPDECPIDVDTGGQTSPVSDDFPIRETPGDLDIPSTNKDPQSSRPGPFLALNNSVGWHRDSISPLETHNETNQGLLSPESSLLCPRIFSAPPPDLPVRPSIETSIQDGSIVGDTELVEHSGDRTGSLEGEVVAPIVQVNEPLPSKAMSGEDATATGRLTEDSHTSVPFCFTSQTRSTCQSQAILVKTPSPRPRRNLRSTRREQFPAVSVVIPTRRNDELVARTRKNRLTASKRCRHLGSSENDRESRMPMDSDYPPRSDKPKYRAGCCSPKPRKRAKKNRLPSSNAGEKCANQPRESSEGGMAFTLGKTEEIFGRGVLRIQANGPRYAYFMTFLPEVSLHSPMSCQTSHEQQPRDQIPSENVITRQVRQGRRCRRSVSTACEKGDGNPSEIQRASFFCEGDNESQKKSRKRLKWTTEQIDCLKTLRRDRRRPWSEVTREFLNQYPGRSPGAVQAYCSTHRL